MTSPAVLNILIEFVCHLLLKSPYFELLSLTLSRIQNKIISKTYLPLGHKVFMYKINHNKIDNRILTQCQFNPKNMYLNINK